MAVTRASPSESAQWAIPEVQLVAYFSLQLSFPNNGLSNWRVSLGKDEGISPLASKGDCIPIHAIAVYVIPPVHRLL
jgi:hypothetical protein